MSMVAHHLVHFNSHLEVYIVRHTHRAGKKTQSVLAQTPMSLFAVPIWMLEPVTFIAPLGTWKMDVEKSEFQVE